MTKPARALAYGLIGFGLLETLAMNLFTLAQSWRARTDVPWWDEWALAGDLAQIAHGRAVWHVLWEPYWGERQVVTRLLWMANARLHALGSLTWLTLLFQFAHIAVLIAVAWLLLGRRASAPPFLIACMVILNMLLSPFQMWNFVWSTQIMFVLVCLAATGSFLCLAVADGKHRWLFNTLSIALAVLGTLTMPNGLFVWPVLILQAIYLRRTRPIVAGLTLLGSIAFWFYFLHYTNIPRLGMGVGGMLHHPLQSILLTGVVVAGPVGFISNAAAAGFGVLALAVTAFVCTHALRLNAPERPWLSALVAIVVFQVLSAVSVVAGRLDPRFLGRDPLYTAPVRYPTTVSVLWTAIALLVLYTCWHRRRRRLLLGFYAVAFFYFLFATVPTQLTLAEDWSDFFRGVDAMGAAFFLDAPDEQLLARIWLVPAQREERAAFLRERRLAMFHEPRASWIGKNVNDLFPRSASDRCIGAIEKTTPFGNTARLQGWAWDPQSQSAPDYILFADPAGYVIGQARGGLRHGYIPGLLVEPGTVPASHARLPHSEWLGYLRATGSIGLSLWGVNLHSNGITSTPVSSLCRAPPSNTP